MHVGICVAYGVSCLCFIRHNSLSYYIQQHKSSKILENITSLLIQRHNTPPPPHKHATSATIITINHSDFTWPLRRLKSMATECVFNGFVRLTVEKTPKKTQHY